MAAEASRSIVEQAEAPPPRPPLADEPLGPFGEAGSDTAEVRSASTPAVRSSHTSGDDAGDSPDSRAGANLDLTLAAQARIKKKVDAFDSKLITTSRAVAASQQVDVVSEIHVEQASRQLEKPKKTRRHYLGAVSGLLAGASLGNLMEVIGGGGAVSSPIGLTYLVVFTLGTMGIAWEPKA